MGRGGGRKKTRGKSPRKKTFMVRSNFYGDSSKRQIIGSWHPVKATSKKQASQIFRKGSTLKEHEIDIREQ